MVSMLSGPIAAHPPFDRGDLPPGRTRPEAAEFASHGTRGTVGMLFEVTGRGYSAGGGQQTRKSKSSLRSVCAAQVLSQ